jgi:predicted RNA-binding protein with TRAM domain
VTGKAFVTGVLSVGGGLTLEISEKLLCLFSAEVRDDGDTYTVEIPKREIDTGSIEPGGTYRVALIASERAEPAPDEPEEEVSDEPQPPVEAGEIRYVEIEDIGKQGDGIARVERGYVIIVPGADIGERVKVEITEVKSNFAVGEIIDEDI